MVKWPEHGYVEEVDDKELHYWRASTLWKLSGSIAVEHVPLESFDWQNDNFQCNSLSDPPLWRDIGDHARRIINANMQYPIIINANGDVMDGMHRILKAYTFGLPTINAIRFTQNPEPDLIVPLEFNLITAQEWAGRGRIEDWVLAYTSSGEWVNMPLYKGLQLAKRYWVGPVELSLEEIPRVAGPEPDMTYRQDPDGWEKRITAITTTFKDINDMPPLIIEVNDGKTHLADGNHRHEALRRLGYTICWCVIWYNNEEEYKNSPYG